MINILNKIIRNTNNSDYVSREIQNLAKQTSVKKIFESIKIFSPISEIRFVGGCIRKIIKKEIVDDIDLATNLTPIQICESLRNDKINFYDTGIDHGTITAIIGNHKYEITSLREDLKTDGRHANVRFSTDWRKDAARRDFTMNSIYSDLEGNLFDPFEGKKDLENGIVRFIGDPEQRIREDYLRILRYLRFFLGYSNHKHDNKTLKLIKKNIDGISNLSKDRLLDELKKCIRSNVLINLSKDKFSLELYENIFPEIKNIRLFSKLNDFAKKKVQELDFIFILSILIIDGSDNVDYFIYKFNISKKNQKRLKIIDNFFKEKINIKSFSEKNLNKIFYYHGRQSVIDIISYRLFTSKKTDRVLLDLLDQFQTKDLPTMPVSAKFLMENFNISEGKNLGDKLRLLENEWINNDFKLTDKQISEIIGY